MWILFSGLSLTLLSCGFTAADEIPSEPSVLVECCGRLRHGVVAVGGETTGTTVTFNRVVWELQLPDEASREFAENHNKELIKVSGQLRRIAGTEVKVRWVIDVKTLSKIDETTDKVGTRMTIRGTLRSRDPQKRDGLKLAIHSADQIWPIDLSTEEGLRAKAESLLGQAVLLKGTLEHDTEKESLDPIFIRVRTIDKAESP